MKDGIYKKGVDYLHIKRQVHSSLSNPRQVEADHFRFGHFLQGKFQTFAPKAGVFHAPERHRVKPVVSRVVDHHAAAIEFISSFERHLDIAREDCRQQTLR